jgi:hypothetical protein
MSHHWNESEVTIEHPGMQSLKRGDPTEVTDNILYSTKSGSRYDDALVIVESHMQLGFAELEKQYGGQLREPINKYLQGKLSLEEFKVALKSLNPVTSHTHKDQVDGAAEVFALLGERADADEIRYEKIREAALETMRKNAVYQFCMLLAGFTNEDMNKYWITPSESTISSARTAPPVTRTKTQKVKIKGKIVAMEFIGTTGNYTQYFDVALMDGDGRERGGVVQIERKIRDIDTDTPIDETFSQITTVDMDKINKYVREFNNAERVDGADDRNLRQFSKFQKRYTQKNPFPEIFVTSKISEEIIHEETVTGEKQNISFSGKSLEVARDDYRKIDINAKVETSGRFHRWYVQTSWADGHLHLSPMIYAHLEEAHNMVILKWHHLSHVEMQYFITSGAIRAHFARLVAYNIRTSDVLSGKKYQLVSTYQRVNHEKAKLLNLFRHVRMAGSELIYDHENDPGGYVRGTTYTDRYKDTLAVENARQNRVFGPSYERMGSFNSATLSRYFATVEHRYDKRLKLAYPNMYT